MRTAPLPRPVQALASRRLAAVLTVTALAAAVLVATTPTAPAEAATAYRAVHVAGGGVGDQGAGEDALTRPHPRSVVRLPRGEVGWFDYASQQVRVLTPDGTVADVFGNGRRGDADQVGGLAGAHARYTALPTPSDMWSTPDGALWLAVNSWIVRIDPVTHLLSTHVVPQVNGGTVPLLVRRDGSLVVGAYDGTPRVATLPAGWGATTPLTTLAARVPGRFAEAPDGTLYEAWGAGVYRWTGGSPQLVAGTAGSWPTDDDRLDGVPALGATMRPLWLDVDGSGRIAVTDLTGSSTMRVRVISGGAAPTVRTVRTNWTRGGGDGCSSEPRPLLHGDRLLVACAWSLRAPRLDGSDASGEGPTTVGRGEALRDTVGSPSGTEARRAYLPSTAYQLRQHLWAEVAIVTPTEVLVPERSSLGVRRVVVAGTAAQAAAGLDWPASSVSWRVVFPGGIGSPNQVVALVCRDHHTCVVRRQGLDGVWSTLPWPGAGNRPVARVWEHDRAGRRVYFAIGDGPVEYLDLTTSTFGTLAGVPGAPERVAPLRDGRLLLALPGEPTATVYDPTTGLASPSTVPVGLGWAPQLVDLPGYPETIWVSTGDTLRSYTLDGDVHGSVDPALGRSVRRGEGAVDAFPAAVYFAPSRDVMVLGDLVGDIAVHEFTTQALAPAAPPDVRVTPGDGRVTVTWGAVDARGSTVFDYRVTSRDGSSVTVAADQRKAVVVAPNGVADHYTVSARSSKGTGDASLRSAWAVPVDRTAPAPVTLGTTSHAVGSMKLRWTKPADADLADVVVTRRTGTTTPRCTAGSGTTVVYTGTGTTTTQRVTPGTTYSFAVCARDTAGNLSTARAVRAVGTRSTLTTTVDGRAVTAVTYGGSTDVVHTVRLRQADGADVRGATVSLQTRRKGSTGPWTTVARSTTSSTGSARLTHRPTVGTEYRVHYTGSGTRTGSVSAVRVLDVRTRVTATASASTARRGSSVTISGTVYPNHSGRTVRLQQKTSSGWTTVKEQALTSSSTYRFSVTRSRSAAATTLTYRVVPVAKPGYVAGAGPSRSVRWT